MCFTIQRMVCSEKVRLIQEYSRAAYLYRDAVKRLKKNMAIVVPGSSFSEEAEIMRSNYEQARLALQQHTATHEC